jgi:hypothetical protein
MQATLGAIICNAIIALVDWPEMIKSFWVAPIYAALAVLTFLVTARTWMMMMMMMYHG